MLASVCLGCLSCDRHELINASTQRWIQIACLRRNISLVLRIISEFSGSRTRKFNTANTKIRQWTRSWGTSIHLPSPLHIYIKSILIHKSPRSSKNLHYENSTCTNSWSPLMKVKSSAHRGILDFTILTTLEDSTNHEASRRVIF
jgi:hypothetical protein